MGHIQTVHICATAAARNNNRLFFCVIVVALRGILLLYYNTAHVSEQQTAERMGAVGTTGHNALVDGRTADAHRKILHQKRKLFLAIVYFGVIVDKPIRGPHAP